MAFPLNHIYLASKVINPLDSVALLGSMLPDLVLFCPRLKGMWYQFHENGADILHNYIKQENMRSEWEMLLIGMRLHSITTKGLDWYSDTKDLNRPYWEFDGFMFKYCLPIAHDIEMLLGLPGENAIVLAHNFIETAVSLETAKHFPESLSIMENTLTSEYAIPSVKLLAKTFNINFSDLEMAWSLMSNIFSVENQYDLAGYIKIWKMLSRQLMQTTIAENVVKKWIIQAQNLIEDCWEPFLNETTEEIMLNFSQSG